MVHDSTKLVFYVILIRRQHKAEISVVKIYILLELEIKLNKEMPLLLFQAE